jgi:ribosome-binding factor A
MKPEVKKDTNRIAKVNSLVQKELGPILHEFLDWQNGLITITKVDTSKDMKWAKIWISIFNGNPTRKGASGTKIKVSDDVMDQKIMDFLANNIYDIQGELNKHFHTKIIPKISFKLDTSPRYVEHIDELLREVHEEK